MENLKEEIGKFLETADSPETRDLARIKALYELITGKKNKCDNPTCVAKMIREVRKAYHLMNAPQGAGNEQPARKYTLKDGNHSFYPGTPAIHNNDNTTDEDIEGHLKLYPHIKHLLN